MSVGFVQGTAVGGTMDRRSTLYKLMMIRDRNIIAEPQHFAGYTTLHDVSVSVQTYSEVCLVIVCGPF